MTDQAHRIERQLARQSVLHHRKREEQLEQTLADVIALAVEHGKCGCKPCRALRHLAAELKSG